MLKNTILAVLLGAACALGTAPVLAQKDAGGQSAKAASRHKVVYDRASGKVVHRAPKPAKTRISKKKVAALAAASNGELRLLSHAALVLDLNGGQTLYAKNTDHVQPIASITKLMTAMVVLEARQPLDEPITVTEEDIDTLKNTRSRLRVGTVLSRSEMLRLALMASENRAASALARAYPGGTQAFVRQMNNMARLLGLSQTQFADPTGLSPDNVSSVKDLARLVTGAYQYDLIREYSTTPGIELDMPESHRSVHFNNTNQLVKNEGWEIGLSKTGYISESGKCLVMHARIAEKPVVIVLLDAKGRYSRIGDANRIKKWIEAQRSSLPARNT